MQPASKAEVDRIVAIANVLKVGMQASLDRGEVDLKDGFGCVKTVLAAYKPDLLKPLELAENMVNAVVSVANNLKSKDGRVPDMQAVVKATGGIILVIKPSLHDEVQAAIAVAAVVQEVVKNYRSDGKISLEQVVKSVGSIVLAVDSTMLPVVEIV